MTTWQERGAAYVSRQYRAALESEHEVFIYARGGEGYAIGDPNWDGERVTWGKKIPIHMPLSIDLSDFRRWIKKNNLGLVFFNEQQWWDPVILCQELGVKTGAYIDYYTAETVPFFGIYDFLICNTKRHHSVFTWHPQAVYIPWGTDIQIFKPGSLAPVLQDKVTFFHSVGFSPERKGTDILIRALAELRGPVRLLVHSQIDLIKAYPDLSSLISQLMQENKLVIRQETVGAPGLYHLGDVYVYPSRLDGIGLSLPEALACGLPTITSDNPPMNEFINESCGRLVALDGLKPRHDGYYWPLCEPNVASLTVAMQFYVDHLADLTVYKKQARQWAEESLDWSKNSRPLASLFSGFRRLPDQDKRELVAKIKAYELKRSNWPTKLYRRFPWLFAPFSWLWPLIKRKYIIR